MGASRPPCASHSPKRVTNPLSIGEQRNGESGFSNPLWGVGDGANEWEGRWAPAIAHHSLSGLQTRSPYGMSQRKSNSINSSNSRLPQRTTNYSNEANLGTVPNQSPGEISVSNFQITFNSQAPVFKRDEWSGNCPEGWI